jgi:hypothetical protein
MGRRSLLGGGVSLLTAAWGLRAALADAAEPLTFDQLYKSFGVLGLEFSDRLLALQGRRARITGFMAPPLKPETNFFVLTREPVAICPFCSSDAEWPVDIVVVYLERAMTPRSFSDPLEVTGTLDVGSKIDAVTGFVSQIRLLDAQFRSVS